MKAKANKMPYSVDNVTGDTPISEVFARKFKHLFNSVGYDQETLDNIKQTISSRIKSEYGRESECMVTKEDLTNAIKYISSGKADGNLGLFSDHVIQGDDMLYDYLTLLYNGMVIHGCSPSDMIVGTMIPIPKNKRLNASISDNFRGICLQSVLCKLLDIIILTKEMSHMKTSDLQYGFKAKLSAAMATTVFR